MDRGSGGPLYTGVKQRALMDRRCTGQRVYFGDVLLLELQHATGMLLTHVPPLGGTEGVLGDVLLFDLWHATGMLLTHVLPSVKQGVQLAMHCFYTCPNSLSRL